MNTNKNSIRYFFLLLMLVITSACTERIDIMTDGAEPHLVIYGYITTDTTRHSIRITRSGNYFATTAPEGISKAVVTISTENEVIVLTEDPTEPGTYLTDADVYGIEGETYTLNVSVDFDGNNQVEEYTAFSYLPYPVKIDSIRMEPSDVFDDRIDILFYGRMPEEEVDALSFHAFRNDFAMNDSLIDFSVVEAKYIKEQELKDVRCFSLKQDEEKTTLEDGDFVTLQVNSITQEYCDFIYNAQSELYGSNPIFGGPPANVQTNIKPVRTGNNTPLVGFFTAYSTRSKGRVYKE